MGIQNYKLDIDKLIQYLETGKSMNFVIDFTVLLRLKAKTALDQLSTIPRSKCCWYVIPKFESQIESLLETGTNSSGIFFFTEKMMDSLEESWEIFSNIPIHLADDVATANDFVQKLTGYGKDNCLVTGNETEAWRHILNKNHGHIILISDEEIYYLPETCFQFLYNEVNTMLPVTKLNITNDFCKKCKTSSGKTIEYEGILSDTSAEGTLFLAKGGKRVVKIFHGEIAEQKLLKIQKLMSFSDKKESFAWPLEFVYPLTTTNNNIPIGFTMPRMKCDFSLEEIYTLEIDGQPISEHARWKVATSLLAQVLFLYIHGIQIGDFNPNNFCVTNNCDVVLMDMDSYVIGRLGTQMKGRQAMPFTVDYSSKKDVIKADYVYLIGTVFEILTDGYWPFFYNEDTGLGEYKFTEDDNISEEYKDTLKNIPNSLRRYFSKVLERQVMVDPFELYFLLMENEPSVPVIQTQLTNSWSIEDITDLEDDEEQPKNPRSIDIIDLEDDEQQPVKKQPFFTRVIKGIKNFFSE